MTKVKKAWTAGLLSILLLFISAVPQTFGITVQEEEDLSKEFMKYVKQQYTLVDDPFIERYLNDLGQKLLKHYPPQPFTFHFYVVEQDVYNAFAGPAGHVFVNSGLFAAMDNESELAGILCHEIGHVVCRHISKNIERSGKISIGTLAGMMAGILMGAAGSGSAATAMTISSIAAGQSVSLAFSREDEQQADEVGAKALEAAGYSVRGMITMLKKIKARDWYGSDIPSYLETHPGVDDRIVYLSRDLVAEGTSPVKPKISEEAFNRAHTRLLALYGDKQTAVTQFKAMAEKDPGSFLPDYGMGLLAFREGNREEAKAYLKKALEKNAFDSYLLTDLGQNYFLDGDYQSARKILEAATSMDSKNLEGRLFLGQTLLEMKKFSGAQNIFERLLVDSPDYSKARYYLGETFSRQGRTGEAFYNLGLYYLQTGDEIKAVFNLKRAQMETTDASLLKEIKGALENAERMNKKGKKNKKDKKGGSEDDGEGWRLN